jgi:methionyl aminopeptidase
MGITIKSEREIDLMRQAGRMVAEVLAILAKSVKPGLKTKELDIIAEREIKRLGGKSSFKGYRGYPAHLCVSINDEIVHGIPGDRIIREGDIVSLDFGAVFKGYQGDAAKTVGVGVVTPQAEALIKTTEGALMAGLQMARDQNRLGDISSAVQQYAESRGFSVVREYTGHGIGRQMHEDPLIPNFGVAGTGIVLKKGMTLAIEPMLNAGEWRTRLDNNEWTVHTADGSLSAHFENTIVITDGDPEILTIM